MQLELPIRAIVRSADARSYPPKELLVGPKDTFVEAFNALALTANGLFVGFVELTDQAFPSRTCLCVHRARRHAQAPEASFSTNGTTAGC